MSRFVLKTKLPVLAIVFSSLGLTAAEAVNFSGVEITSDRFTTNLVTSLSRLEGNVTLSHQGITIESGFAEAHPQAEDKDAKFVLGQNLQMRQAVNDYNVNATGANATYFPNASELRMRGNVQFKYQQTGQNFSIRAEDLQVIQSENQLSRLLAKGKPGILTHEIEERRIIITASSIDWKAGSEIAIMLDASLDDGSTTFSASEIEYNTRTGAVSAKGQGDERPRYRFNTEQENKKETEQDDDT